MRLLVGLGNPGPKYTFTRHNIGWLVIDQVVLEENLGIPKMRHQASLWGPLSLYGQKFLILKPLTYMNLSGLAVANTASYFDISHKDILVVYDDMALPFGTVRLRAKGSSGGHKGMQSIINSMGSQDIPRIRVGIGAPSSNDTIAHVLSVFSKEEQKLLPEIIERSALGIRRWSEQDIQKAMSSINSQV